MPNLRYKSNEEVSKNDASKIPLKARRLSTNVESVVIKPVRKFGITNSQQNRNSIRVLG